ncbi:hypothetical protein CVT25_012857 [Psilocybe cyanescens]|uniref:Extracellular membrane protein CFEM domain-containing protein n=1 Tax=Psilocybe cyanescens TaxID=93625 RepID=A0A409XLY9_PSICY|nr:hypothetical protein CVT25_012857 [Psilocybe cyanescens]
MIVSVALATVTISLSAFSVVAESLASPAILYSRQVSGFDPSQIPVSCIQTKCSDYVNTITQQNCITLDCLCSTNIVNALKSCEQCVVDANIPGLTQSDVDNAISGFVQSCSDAGHPVSGVSGSGGSVSSGGLDSSSPANSSASSASTSDSPSQTNDGVAMGTNVFRCLFALALGLFTFSH